ncbi:glutamate-5-semialdehyde dehydrogenase [Microbacteriaceae bacterium MWH-Ta3]|nr:glutamate-5-semialdehyde dehydrogenase [Microbacteriaceae bacterium MWH-Ta3]
MTRTADGFQTILDDAREASIVLARATTTHKNAALESIAAALVANTDRIVEANGRDLERGIAKGMPAGLQDRLTLTHDRVQALAAAVRAIIELPDPVGGVVRGGTLANGLQLTQVRVPFGVVGAIYEARPNVTVDLAAICLKSGNAAVLRGGSDAEESNKVLVDVIGGALEAADLPRASVASIDAYGRDGAQRLMNARGYVDVLVPRGSAGLINAVVNDSSVPVIETGAGVVHIFLDETADLDMANDIVHNAKTQRVGVCNAVETLLVHRHAVDRLLPAILQRLHDSGVVIHADEDARATFPAATAATDEDWGREYLSMDIAVRVVADVDAAIAHIRRHSTHHTESIITNDMANAEKFLAEVDSAVVMVNASTRFTDGGEFGFGAEVGISTQKLHARGPMGLPELTSSKWIVRGNGQWRR